MPESFPASGQQQHGISQQCPVHQCLRLRLGALTLLHSSRHTWAGRAPQASTETQQSPCVQSARASLGCDRAGGVGRHRKGGPSELSSSGGEGKDHPWLLPSAFQRLSGQNQLLQDHPL